MLARMQMVTNTLKNPLSKIKQSIKQMSKQMTNQKIQIVQIIKDKMYHISYPTETNIQSLQQHLKGEGQYQIWNISQYSYSEQIITKLIDQANKKSPQRQLIYNLTYEYFANIPFCEMIKGIQNIESFLSINTKNKVYIHCQQNKTRSAVFLASYIFLTGIQTDIVQSILTVNKLLKISIEDKEISHPSSGSIYKSQHLVLKNLMNYINNNSFIHKNTWHLKKIMINNAPKIHSVLRMNQFKENTNIFFKVLLEIRSVQGVICKKIFNDQFVQGEAICLRIPSNQKILLKDDFLIIIKYVHNKKGYSILRSQLNTNFIYDPYSRIQRNDMDLSVNNTHTNHQSIFMDLLLQQYLQEQSELSNLTIIKDSSQKQSTNSSHEEKKQSNFNNQKKQINLYQEDDEDNFKILDQEEQAEHNQKMQRQVQEQLKRQLQNLKKKKSIQKGNNSGKKDYSQLLQLDIKFQENIKKDNQSQDLLSSNKDQKQNKDEIANQINNQRDFSENVDKNCQQSTKIIPSDNKNEQQCQDKKVALNISNNQQDKNQTMNLQSQNQNVKQTKIEASSQQQNSSSQEEQSESDQEEEQEQDLDDYLTKLQKQAQKQQ